jgi:hypothetical protein
MEWSALPSTSSTLVQEANDVHVELREALDRGDARAIDALHHAILGRITELAEFQLRYRAGASLRSSGRLWAGSARGARASPTRMCGDQPPLGRSPTLSLPLTPDGSDEDSGRLLLISKQQLVLRKMVQVLTSRQFSESLESSLEAAAGAVAAQESISVRASASKRRATSHAKPPLPPVPPPNAAARSRALPSVVPPPPQMQVSPPPRAAPRRKGGGKTPGRGGARGAAAPPAKTPTALRKKTPRRAKAIYEWEMAASAARREAELTPRRAKWKHTDMGVAELTIIMTQSECVASRASRRRRRTRRSPPLVRVLTPALLPPAPLLATGTLRFAAKRASASRSANTSRRALSRRRRLRDLSTQSRRESSSSGAARNCRARRTAAERRALRCAAPTRTAARANSEPFKCGADRDEMERGKSERRRQLVRAR